MITKPQFRIDETTSVREAAPIVTLLRIEGAVALATALVAFQMLGGHWGLFAAAFLAPDIAMIGYVRNAKIGALLYNAAHVYIGPALLAAALLATGWTGWLVFCAVWTAHIGFDRMLGYGLKQASGFRHTHLGRL